MARSPAALQPVLALDGAAICDKLTSYLGCDFDDFDISAVTRNRGQVVAIVIEAGGGSAADVRQAGHLSGSAATG